MQQITKYEFHIEPFSTTEISRKGVKCINSIISYLNMMSEQGWELFHVEQPRGAYGASTCLMYHFRRPISL